SLNPGYSISGNTISWVINSNSTFFNYTDYINFTIPGGLINGAQHYFTSTISSTTITDCNSSNNNGNLLQILGNSYDPNDKNVFKDSFYAFNDMYELPELENVIEDKLTYTIRFQNTGTAPAQNIYIQDTLSANLDWSTFELLSSSHPMFVNHLGNGILRFEFDNIWLVDSSVSQELSQGYLTYRISENGNCSVGCEIENTAYIYFDWNDPIVTNTTYNINVATWGLSDMDKNLLQVFPNPSSGMLNVKSNEKIECIEVFDLFGKSLIRLNSVSNESQLDLNSFASGNYILKAKFANGTIQRKISVY
ncbi:MAG: T9SS type A sorting domain-containing protein, partial [Crocinitomicaceae bacterium]